MKNGMQREWKVSIATPRVCPNGFEDFSGKAVAGVEAMAAKDGRSPWTRRSCDVLCISSQHQELRSTE